MKKSDNATKVLIVEDEKLFLEPINNKFIKEGFNVITAENGEEGLAMALTERPDIILLDIVMPKMDGFTMLNKLRQDKWGKNVPVIILSNLSDSDKVAEAVSNRVFDFLVKSDWTLDDIVKKVNEQLAKHK